MTESIFDFEWALTSWLCMHQYCLRYWNVEGTDLIIRKRWEAVSRNTRHTRDHQEQTSPFSYPSSLPRKDDGPASQLWQRFPCHLLQGLIMSVFVDLRTASPDPHWFVSEKNPLKGLRSYVNSTMSGMVSCDVISELVWDERRMPTRVWWLLRMLTWKTDMRLLRKFWGLRGLA